MKFSLSVGIDRIAAYTPENAADAAPPAREELDILLEAGIDTRLVTSSGQAQKLIATLRERDRLGLATPKQLDFLRNLGVPDDVASTMKKRQAGAIMGRRQDEWKRERWAESVAKHAASLSLPVIDWGMFYGSWGKLTPAEVVVAARAEGVLPPPVVAGVVIDGICLDE